ncbi:MAG: 50S ribosomal protein L13 [Chloroflexia bacterium]
MKTYMPKRGEITQEWYVVDAAGKTLGRLAARIATVLRGKHKAAYTPHLDGGDYVVVVNAEKVVLTGRKREQKVYYHHTGYMGGLRRIPLAEMLERHPERVIRMAVEGMLPRNRLGRAMLRKLKVYAGPNHPHQAQNPKPLEL